MSSHQERNGHAAHGHDHGHDGHDHNGHGHDGHDHGHDGHGHGVHAGGALLLAPPPAAPAANAHNFGSLNLDIVVPYLLDRQLLTARDLVATSATIEDRTRRNRNFRVRLEDRPGYHVKQPVFGPGDLSMVPFVVREARFFDQAMHDDVLSALGRLMPRHAYFDRRNIVSVTELVYPSTSITKLHLNLGRPQFPEPAAASCARALATVHEVAKRAWKQGRLDFLEVDTPLCVNVLAHVRERVATEEQAQVFLDLLAQKPPIVATIDALRARLKSATPLGVVQGDLRWDNYLLTHGAGPSGDLNLRIIDWELVHLGDPMADVAGWFGEYFRFRIEQVQRARQTTAAGILESPLIPIASWHPSARTFWETYCRRRRITGERRRQALERVAEFLGPALVMLAWELVNANASAGFDDPVKGTPEAALALAEKAFADPMLAMKEWFDLAD